MGKKYKLVVMSNAVDGAEDAYNDWYSNTHLADVVKIDGFTRAQRYRTAIPMSADPLYKYCAIYDVETDDPQGVLEALNAASGTPAMELSDALDPRIYAVLYEEFDAPVSA